MDTLNIRNTDNVRYGAIVLASLMYLASLFLPVVELQSVVAGDASLNRLEAWEGWKVLTAGWAAIGNGTFAWLANVCFLAALVCFVRRREDRATELALTVLGLVIALSSWVTMPEFQYRNGDFSLWQMGDFRIGAQFWIFAQLVLFVGVLHAAVMHQRVAQVDGAMRHPMAYVAIK